jgi:hypothetical protein
LLDDELIVKEASEGNKQGSQTQGVKQKDTAHEDERNLMIQSVDCDLSLALLTIY